MNSYKNQRKKDLRLGWDFNPGPKRLAIVAALRHPPPPRVAILFIYHTIRTKWIVRFQSDVRNQIRNGITIQISGLYGFIRVAFSQPLLHSIYGDRKPSHRKPSHAKEKTSQTVLRVYHHLPKTQSETSTSRSDLTVSSGTPFHNYLLT